MKRNYISNHVHGCHCVIKITQKILGDDEGALAFDARPKNPHKAQEGT